ncbi:Radical SAM domain protein [uncultured Desulfatiglans sp.]|nr:Radical SAM domain protein [uncultured Desulfatiglans sp.]
MISDEPGETRMNSEAEHPFRTEYPYCRRLVGESRWRQFEGSCQSPPGSESFYRTLRDTFEESPFIGDLARLEGAIEAAASIQLPARGSFERIAVNPTLSVLDLGWRHLPSLMNDPDGAPEPQKGREFVLAYRHPESGNVISRAAGNDDLLALKLLADEIPRKQAAEEAGIPPAALDQAVDRAVGTGLLIAPPSAIRRSETLFSIPEGFEERFLRADVFTLQWHITQACDLHCKHCYDRSARTSLPYETALSVLEGFYAFCEAKHVRGQISFTGGNPLLHPRFLELYRRASDLGFALAVLGNPASREDIEAIVEIEMPVYYQVSLEGLREHNDAVRQAGHFDRTLSFLDLLREFRIYSMVMLTLTDANIDQVLPLADLLQRRTDLFTFNRLSLVGEGVHLRLPSQEAYRRFCEAYLEAATRNPVIGLKDNLLNRLLYKRGSGIFGGCAGYGCGAAFNFMTVLPDGEVHACRKFPSPIGNVLTSSILEIYDSKAAGLYRAGSEACASCAIRPVCGGCLAVAYSSGIDIFRERDPFCPGPL